MKKIDFIFINYDIDVKNRIMDIEELKNLCLISDDVKLFEQNINILDDNCWFNLCKNKNKNIIDFIEKNIDRLVECCNEVISLNPYAVEMLERNELINWIKVFANEKALKLIEYRLNSDRLNYNNAVEKLNDIEERLLEEHKNFYKNNYHDEEYGNLTNIYELSYYLREEYHENRYDIFDKHEGEAFCENKHAGYLIEKYLIDKDGYCIANFSTSDTKILSKNEYAIEFLKKYPSFINWTVINQNKHHKQLLCANLDIDSSTLYDLCKLNDNFSFQILQNHMHYLIDKHMDVLQNNTNYIRLINKLNMIEKHNLEKNNQVCNYDYNKIKEIKHNINKDFTEWIWKPEHRYKWNTLKLI